MLIKKHLHGLIWYNFSIFEPHPELVHGVLTRHGGLSGPKGEDLNLAFNEADAPENVLANIKRAEEALGLPPANFIRQTHSTDVVVIRAGDNYQAGTKIEGDALVAPETQVTLLIKLADCQGLILYDPITTILALVHSGWRGSVQNIICATVMKMVDFGADPANILAAISPSLGPCCAEFVNHERELPEHFRPFMVRPNYFDFWAISRQQLTDCGLKPQNVETAGICTKCSPDFFSYRRGDQWGRFGVMAAVLNH